MVERREWGCCCGFSPFLRLERKSLLLIVGMFRARRAWRATPSRVCEFDYRCGGRGGGGGGETEDI